MSRTRWTVALLPAIAAAVLVAVGVSIAAAQSFPHEWPWQLAILGSGIVFLTVLLVPQLWSGAPLLVVIGLLALWFFTAGILVDLADSNNTLGLAPEAIGVFAAGITVFFGVLLLSGVDFADSSMRHAFGATLLVVYVGLLVIGAFHTDWAHSAIGDKLIDQLSTLFGVVVAFYFGSTATVEYLKYRERQTTIRAGKTP